MNTFKKVKDGKKKKIFEESNVFFWLSFLIAETHHLNRNPPKLLRPYNFFFFSVTGNIS